jgi:hypothetical protein
MIGIVATQSTAVVAACPATSGRTSTSIDEKCHIVGSFPNLKAASRPTQSVMLARQLLPY